MRNKKLVLFRISSLLLIMGLFVGTNSYSQEKLSKKELEKINQDDHIALPAKTSLEKGVMLYESFEGTFPPSGWVVTDAGGDSWAQSSFSSYSGDYCARHGFPYYDCDNWLISPPIEVDGGNIALSFAQKLSFGGSYYDYHGVYVATEADMSDAVFIYEGYSTSSDWEIIELPLSDFDGETVYIGFNYQGYDADTWYIDDFTIKTIPYQNYLLSYSFDYLAKDGVINNDYTVDISVPYHVGVDTLTAFFEVSAAAKAKVSGKIQVSGETQNDFTNPVLYNIISADGLTRDYTVYVTKDEPLVDFTLSSAVYSYMYNDTIMVIVPANEDLAAQVVEFTMDDATYKLLNGATELVDGTTEINVASTVTLTAVAGDYEKDYTLIVSKEDPITTFNFTGYVDNGEIMPFAIPIYGVIDGEGLTIDLEVPYGTPTDSLISTYNVKSYVSALAFDGQTLNGVDTADYSDNGDLVLTLEDPTKGSLTFTVTVTHDEGSYNNEILGINIPNLVGELMWDRYGRKVEGYIMYDSTMVIKPEFTISPLATIVDTTTAHDFAAGPATYTVTSQNGEEVAEWLLTLTEVAASTDAELIDFDYVDMSDWWLNEDNDTLLLSVADADIDLTKVEFSALEVSFGATFTPTTVSGTLIDFSTQPVSYTVTAQDGETVVEYAAYVFPEEEVAPVVNVAKGEYSNVSDSVKVTFTDASSLLGFGFGLVHKDIMDDFSDIMDDDDAMEEAEMNGELVIFEYDDGVAATEFNVPVTGLKPGIFYAIGGDTFGNMSEFSADSAVIKSDTMMVASFEEMEYFGNVIYYYTGEAVVTYGQSYRHQKRVQDGTMGMLIDDSHGYVSDTVVVGDKITGLYGKMINYNGTIEFQPIALTAETASIVSRDNEVEPLALTFEEFNADIYEYQNMLVKLTDVVFTQADGSNYFTNGAKYNLEEVTSGFTSTFRTTFYSVDYIGDTLPEGIWNIVGIKNVRDDAPVFTARNSADFMLREGFEFNIDPEEWDASMIGVANDMKTFTISNTGVESFTIANAYIEGAPEFSMVNIYNTEIEAYSEITFDVDFEPADFGTYESVMKVMLTSGDIYEVALTASVSNIPTVDYPYVTDFNTEESITGWVVDNMDTGAGFQWGSGLSDTYSFYRVGYNNPSYPDHDHVMLVSPPIDMSNAIAPVLSWANAVGNEEYGYGYIDLRVTTDDQVTWTTIAQIHTTGFEQVPISFDVSDYAGESKVQFGFYLYEPSGAGGSPVIWWDVDDFAVVESPTMPIFAINTDSIGMGVVEGTYSFPLTIANEGASFFTLNSVTLKTGGSTAITLTDAPTTAVEVYEQEVVVGVNFDGTLGEQTATILVSYSDVRMGDVELEIPVTAFGVGCSASTAAVVGENTAPYAPSWFSYTPTNDALLTISSCGGGVDTDLEVFKGCDGDKVAANDDSGCPDYASEVVFPAAAGVTYMIHWTPKWSASGFTWTLASEDLATAPVLLTAEASAVNATTGKVALTFEDMIELIPAKKGVNNVYSESAIEKDRGLSKKQFVEPVAVNHAKTFVPDGDPEIEPNGDRNTAHHITVGTADAPAKVTGHYGVQDDYDWFSVLSSEIGFYFDITLEVEDGTCDMFLVYDNDGWYGWKATATAGNPASFDFTQLDRGVDTMFIWVRRGDMAAVEEPGLGYNLAVWSSAPPTFSIYRDNLLVAGPESMAFSYIDQGINLDQEYCYSITQELYDGSESEFSNSICVTATAGTGDICSKSVEVGPGLNTSPKSPYWYTYTPTESNMVTISSNIEENGDPSEDWNDTWLFIYENCDDDAPIYENDDVQSGVIRTSELQFAVEAGVTYLIHWRRWAPEGEDNAYDAEPFFFSIVEEEMLAGDLVETALPVELPLVDFAGTTAGFNHDYDATKCDYIFMEGSDVCYTFSVPYGGTITGGITGEYAGMHVIKGKPGADECVAFAGGVSGATFTDQPIEPGDYYIIVSTKLPSNEIDFVMNLDYTVGAKQTVTLNVDMNTQITLGNFDAANDTVDVVGTFNLWEGADLTDTDGDGVYTYEIPTDFFLGEELNYKYRINHDWDKAEFSSDIYGAREWTVLTEGNVTNDLFNDVETPTFDVTFKVVMSRQIELGNFDPAANTVGITADVSGDIPALTDNDGTFTYMTTVSVDYGTVITYHYDINGTAEESGDRVTGAIVDDAVYTVWYNNDDKVSVDADLASNLSVYPNPATSELTVEFGLVNTANTTVQIVDISGQVVKSIDMNSRSLVNVDVTEYAKGVYYLKVTNGESVSIQKVVIQ